MLPGSDVHALGAEPLGRDVDVLLRDLAQPLLVVPVHRAADSPPTPVGVDESEVLVGAAALDEVVPEDPRVGNQLALDFRQDHVAGRIAVDERRIVQAQLVERRHLLDAVRLMRRRVDAEHGGEVLLAAKLPEAEAGDRRRPRESQVGHVKGPSSIGLRHAWPRSVTTKPNDS